MATGDKLVTLDGLKAVYDVIDDDISDVKSSTSLTPTGGQIAYRGDTKSSSGFLVNALSYDDGVIVGARSNGKLVKIGYDGTEETLLSLQGTTMDWRCLFKDSRNSVFASPHASYGSMNVSDRGLYKYSLGWFKNAIEQWTVGSMVLRSVGNELTFNDSATLFRYTYSSVSDGDVIRATLYSTSSTTNTYGAFTDDNLIIKGSAFKPSDGVSGYRTFDGVTVPAGATRLYIMTYCQSDWESRCSIETYKYNTVKVISLYDTSSSIQTETENNNDTIWTMCEDENGYLYAGVYAHTIRANPAIYKSTDGGNTWTYLINFNTAGLTSNGMHVHSIVYSKWQKALYCIIGEVNTIFKSTDGGNTWTDLHITLTDKGTVILPTQYGLLVGSDNAYNCEIDLILNDDATVKTVFFGWANTVFAIKQSDVTGIIYAFTKVDSSVNSQTYFPPNSALTNPADLETWKTTSGHNVSAWTRYYNSVIDTYPSDAIRPTHFGILVSRDGGLHWDVLKRFDLIINPSTGNTFVDGFWASGSFLNGELLNGRMQRNAFTNPVVISEGIHKYVSSGCDLSGEILIRTNSSSIVTPL